MNRSLVSVCLLCVACAGSTTEPTPPPRSTASSVIEPQADPPPSVLPVALLPWRLALGPSRGCFDAGSIFDWTVAVEQAAHADFHFVLQAFHDPIANCEETTNHATTFAYRGETQYPNGRTGELLATYDSRPKECGRWQGDIWAKRAGVSDVLIVGVIVKGPKDCDPPPPPPPPPPPSCVNTPSLCPPPPPPPSCANTPSLCPPPPPPPSCVNTPSLCPPPPPPPSCEVLNPPAFTTPVFTALSSSAPIAASVTVSNAATWSFVLYSASSSHEYPNQPDYTKVTETKTLTCGQSKTLSVSYAWQTHPSRYWWVKLFKNGLVVHTSAVVDKNAH